MALENGARPLVGETDWQQRLSWPTQELEGCEGDQRSVRASATSCAGSNSSTTASDELSELPKWPMDERAATSGKCQRCSLILSL